MCVHGMSLCIGLCGRECVGVVKQDIERVSIGEAPSTHGDKLTAF